MSGGAGPSPSKVGRKRGASGSGAGLPGSLYHPPSASYISRAATGLSTTGIDTTPITAQIPHAATTSTLHNFASRSGVQPSAPRPHPGANSGSRAPHAASGPIPIGPLTARTGPGSTAQYMLEGFTERELRDRNLAHRIPARTAPASYRPSPPDPHMEELLERADEQWRENNRRAAEEEDRAQRGLRSRAGSQAAFEHAARGRTTDPRPLVTNRSRTPVYSIPRFQPPPPRPAPPPPPRQSSANRFTVGFDIGRPPAAQPPPPPFSGYGLPPLYRSGAPPRLPSPSGARRGPSLDPSASRRSASPTPYGSFSGALPPRGPSPAFGQSYGSGARSSSRDFHGGPQRSSTPRARGRDPYQSPYGGTGTGHLSPRAAAPEFEDLDFDSMTEDEYNAWMTKSVTATLDAADARRRGR